MGYIQVYIDIFCLAGITIDCIAVATPTKQLNNNHTTFGQLENIVLNSFAMSVSTMMQSK